jgi:hypothetical protein
MGIPLKAMRDQMEPEMTYWRECALGFVSLALFAGIIAVGPIPQDPAYHQFADRRALLGVPNFFNVVSNLGFLFVGIAGTAFCLGRHGGRASVSWTALFVGAAAVAAGSSYYHWTPTDGSLVWDRLPMTIGFMGLFVALLSEHVHPKLESVMLLPALGIGAASVAWWHYTGDLRLYVWVQFMPLVALSLVIAMFPGRYTRRRFILYGLGCYLLAKVAELFDREIFALTDDLLSGHALKHLLAALGLFFIYLMLRWREPVPAPPASPSDDGPVTR